MREHIYTTLEKIFEDRKQDFTEKNLDPLKQIDLFYGQFTLTQKYETFLTPALFLEINCQYNPNPRNANGTADIITHLIIENNQTTDKVNQKKFRSKIFAYHTAMRSVIEQCNSQQFKSPMIMHQKPIEVLNTLVLIKENYQCSFADNFEVKKGKNGEVKGVKIV